jgi:ABC-2 type transport system ATP-binding protein
VPELPVAGCAAAEPVVTVAALSRRFGSKTALDNVSLAVPRGRVFGLVGENGAGKSTLIKHLLGLWRAETGRVGVFGLDPAAEPTTVLVRIGYLSEQPDLPGWMRVAELLRYTRAFYPRWDEHQAAQRQLVRSTAEPRARSGSGTTGRWVFAATLTPRIWRARVPCIFRPPTMFARVLRSAGCWSYRTS